MYIPTVIFLTGYSGSGKSTIADNLASTIPNSAVLDGDKMRAHYTEPLPHGSAGVEENTKRLIASALTQLKDLDCLITAFVAPKAELRARVKKAIEESGYRFLEVFINTSIEVCEKRDPKGLYKRFRNAESILLAGINESYDIPVSPDLVCETEVNTVEEIVLSIFQIFKQSSKV